MTVDNEVPLLTLYGRTELGSLQTIGDQSGIYWDVANFDFSNAAFQILGQFTNVQNLPFVPPSTPRTWWRVRMSTLLRPTFQSSANIYSCDTITLVPQTINATVVGSQQSGSSVDYTVSLAPYDLFPTLAVQQGQTTLLNNPSQIEVYIDNNTQKAQHPGAGYGQHATLLRAGLQ